MDGLQVRRHLNETVIKEIMALASLCNENDQIALDVTLNIPLLQSRNGKEINDFLFYQDKKLVGFLGIYSISSSEEVEISGMVHPEYRRDKIATLLLSQAKIELDNRNISSRLIVCDNSSVSGKSFLDAIGAQLKFAEFSMVLNDTFQPLIDKTLELHLVQTEDLNHVKEILMESSGDSEEEVKELIDRNTNEVNFQMYIAHKKQLPVGTVTISSHEDQTFYITALAVKPKLQGKGYGRQILSQTIERILAHSPSSTIKLEVQIDNMSALGLYKSCGFHEEAAYSYYSF